MAVDGRWSVRTLRERMDGMVFERTAISKQPDALIHQELTQLQQQQYPAIDVQRFQLAHDRFLFIDNDIYHIGASLKDLGKKWFAFSKMAMGAIELLAKVKIDG
jgi:predicted nuclease of restriction endonuclease-like (RecB) superfamily